MRIFLIHIITFGIFSSCNIQKEKVNNPLDDIIPPFTIFKINTSSDTTIFGKYGTRIYIPKNSFIDEKGNEIVDSVELELKEYYKKSDIVLANLSTKSNNQLLETGGMLYLNAHSNGKEVQLTNDLIIHFPKDTSSKQKMNLFYSENSENDSSVTNWEIDTINLVDSILRLYGEGYVLNNDIECEGGYYPKGSNYDTSKYTHPLDTFFNAFNFSNKAKQELFFVPTRFFEVEFIMTEDGKIHFSNISFGDFSKSTRNEIKNMISSLPYLIPCKFKGIEETQIEGSFLIAPAIFSKYKSDKKYIDSFKKKYSEFENKTINGINEAELNYYIFSVSKLGWINCDRFIDIDNKTDLIVNQPINKNLQLKMVFKSINSVLLPYIEDDKIVFKDLPIGEEVTIVAFKNENGRLLSTFKNLKISESEKGLGKLNFQETTLNELTKKLESL